MSGLIIITFSSCNFSNAFVFLVLMTVMSRIHYDKYSCLDTMTLLNLISISMLKTNHTLQIAFVLSIILTTRHLDANISCWESHFHFLDYLYRVKSTIS